jgi:hypothetical protein
VACKANLKNLATALEMYSSDFAGHYPTSLARLTPNYLQQIPTCPAARRDTYSGGFVSGQAPDRYAVWCAGDNHPGLGLGPNLPAYDSVSGLLDRPPVGADLQRCRQGAELAGQAVRRYAAEHQGRPPASLDDLRPRYLARIPSCAGLPLLYSRSGSDFAVFCPGAHHLDQDVQPFHPAYNSKHGLLLPAASRMASPSPAPPSSDWRQILRGWGLLAALLGLFLVGLRWLQARSPE